ncbi:toxin-antitoxin system YwqK family antitoxin [Sphingobacterium hotanense]|uniref:Toxin-antitoxin system YwqK family antitoxin n=1 Tax=Sphingobacterium hotanense TaxID=649196 RepID=A0ABT7NL20_9SPHI|nr:toxin-antitoxin system YwqK family antitoxin [Sphingobacterium hotanense]MDM1047898.1 toxin-antitoxin system YwqK family antitoxin [Sphingobacterium hotanense]
MKIKAILLGALLLLLAFVSIAQNKEFTEYYDSGMLKTSGFKTPSGQNAGKWTHYFENGKPYIIRSYINGKIEGEAYTYYENGNLKSIVNMKNGVAEGQIKTNYESGKLRSITNIKDGKMQGEGRIYTENGKLKAIAHYLDDMQHGELKTYYQNGNVEWIMQYVNDLIEGEAKQYFETGELRSIEKYVGSELEGEPLFYFKNGKPDGRRLQLQELLMKNLTLSKDINTVTEIVVTECKIAIYHKKAGETDANIIEFPTSLLEIEDQGEIKYSAEDVIYYRYLDGDYHISSETNSTTPWFRVKPEGRKIIEELMRSLSNDCNPFSL